MKSIKPLKPKLLFLLTVILSLAVLSCSSDLLNPPKTPEIESLEFNADEVNPGETVTATVSVKDAKDMTLSYEWTANNGEFIPPTDKSQVNWNAPAVGGVYQISVKVSNKDKTASRSKNITVRSPINPDVRILSPASGSYFVQHAVLSVNARAHHDNGISRVDLYVNRNRKATLNGHSSEEYTLTCALDEPSGQAVVKIEALANVTGKAGKDSVRIFIEGVVLGKPHH